MRRTTLVSIAFWIVFIASFGLYKYFPVIDYVWVIALRLALLALAVVTLIRALRHHRTTGEFSYQGYPKWLLRFLIDEEDNAASVDKPR
ncbi:MAG: hypothetical protein ABSF93_08780 [Candidatus Sulfotelmatobacter sp.]